MWLRKIPRKDYTPSKDSVVCIKHFVPEFVVTEDRAQRPDGTWLCMPRTSPKLNIMTLSMSIHFFPTYLMACRPCHRRNGKRPMNDMRNLTFVTSTRSLNGTRTTKLVHTTRSVAMPLCRAPWIVRLCDYAIFRKIRRSSHNLTDFAIFRIMFEISHET